MVVGLIMALSLINLSPAIAASANISHSYQSTFKIPNGSIVSLDTKKSDFVQPANISNGSQIVGVSLASNDSLLAVDPDVSRVQVATSGTVNTLVSTLNGDIDVGDQIAVSPFNGVGMKAELGSHIIGLAQSELNKDTDGVKTQEVTDKNGKKTEVAVGLVRLSIAIGTVNATGQDLNSLQKIAKSFTGHTVATYRILLSLVIAVVTLIALITLIYASIFGSIISIGRNPLAKFAIFRSLGAVIVMAVLTATVSTGVIYLILR